MGWPNVAWGLRNISASELAEWETFYELEPFATSQAELYAGVIASTIANVYRNSKVKPDVFVPFDFMPNAQRRKHMESAYMGDEEEVPKWQSMLAQVEAMNVAFGGKDLRSDNDS